MRLTTEHLLRHFEQSREGQKIITQINQAAIADRQPKLDAVAAINADAARRRPTRRRAR
jgi:hypothetical protein